MDEASRLISELQAKLAQLDHKIWLYRQDMASEFKKHADGLLRDVPSDVSETVNKAVAESMKTYPSIDVSAQDLSGQGAAEDKDAALNNVAKSMTTPPTFAAVPELSLPTRQSPIEGPRSPHEREKEFQGLFTPSYLPLLDSNDRNERRSSSVISSPASESKAIGILSRERAADDSISMSSSYPSTSSLPLHKQPSPRRRNTDELSVQSDQSDTPIRRSALRRSSSSAKPQSPRRVRFEFAGEEFPTTSSPKLESPAVEAAETSPINLGGDDFNYEGEAEEDESAEESPPSKRISSSEALRALSRGPIEDDGTQWMEFTAPADGSASIPSAEVEEEDSDDDDGLTMRPLTVRDAASRANGDRKRTNNIGKGFSVDGSKHQTSQNSQSINGRETTAAAMAEREDAVTALPPLLAMKRQRPMNAISAADLESRYANKGQTVATKSAGKPWFILSTSTDLGDFPESTGELEINANDDDELFAFDEANDRPPPKPAPDPDSEPDSPASETAEKEEEGEEAPSPPINPSHYATSPARAILKPGTPIQQQPSTPHRSSYHPFNTPIVSEAIHTQAASLGNVTSFVGSVKVGLDEDVLQSFREGGVGSGSFRGAPRSFSEKMAFEDAMEARREAAAGGGPGGRKK